MALITCPECGREISDKAAHCIHCGCPIAAQPPEQNEAATKPATRYDNEHFDSSKFVPVSGARSIGGNDSSDSSGGMPGRTWKCPTCGKMLAPNAKFCPNCGRQHPHGLIWLLIGIGIFFLILLFSLGGKR